MVSGKHRQTGLCNHPETDFLEMQVETLKSTLVQKVLEYTKLKQSDALKAKQINNLEAKLQEALTTLMQKIQIMPETVKGEGLAETIHIEKVQEETAADGSFKIQLVENNISNLEQQLGHLSSKFESFLVSFLTTSNSNCPDSSFFIFLQETWLPDHESKSISNDFQEFNFLTTSADMFTPTEDLILQSGPVWHGTCCRLPFVSDRFCGVKYEDSNANT